jgi:hypothetical protein
LSLPYLLLDMENGSRPNQRGHILWYEIMWEREASLTEEIQNSWMAGHPVQSLADVATDLKALVIFETVEQGKIWCGNKRA